MWQIRPGFDYAVSQLGGHTLRPSKQLFFAQKYNIVAWVPEAVRSLLLLPFRDYTEQDICNLSFPGYLVIACAKEEILEQRRLLAVGNSTGNPRVFVSLSYLMNSHEFSANFEPLII